MNPLMAAKAYAAVQGGGMPTGGAAPTAAPGFGARLRAHLTCDHDVLLG